MELYTEVNHPSQPWKLIDSEVDSLPFKYQQDILEAKNVIPEVPTKLTPLGLFIY